MFTSRRSLAATVAVAGVLGFAGTAQAAQVGQLCETKSAGTIYNAAPLGASYFYGKGATVRIDGFDGPSFYKAHTNGNGSGQIYRAAIDQDSCRF